MKDSIANHLHRNKIKNFVTSIIRWCQHNQWIIIGGSGLIALGLGIWGFALHAAFHKEKFSFWDKLYRALQLFVLQSGAVARPVNLPLEIARILAPALGFYAAIKTLFRIFYEPIQSLKLRRLRGHIIICGVGRIGLMLAKRLCENGERVVVIEKDELNDGIPLCKKKGAIVIIGDATHEEVLKKAGVAKARYLIAVSGSDDKNMAIADRAYDATRNRQTPLTCMVNILDPHFSHLLSWRCYTSGKSGNCQLEFFNIIQNGVRILLKNHPSFEKVGDASFPHILVVSCGHFARIFIEHLAREWYHKNLPNGKPLKISLVGKDAFVIRRDLLIRYQRQFKKVCDLSAYTIDVASAEFEQGDFLYNLEGFSNIRKIFVSLETSSQSIGIALKIARLKIRLFGEQRVSIVAVADHKAEMITGSGEDMDVFELLNETSDPALLLNGNVKTIAKALHEVFIQRSQKEGFAPETKPSMKPWAELSEEFKTSSLLSARYLAKRLEAIGCRIMPLINWDARYFKFTKQEIELMAQMEHERWVEERRKLGWKLGAYASDKKTNPWLKPWDELPENVKEYDRELTRELPIILAGVDFEIWRVHYELLAQKLHEDYRAKKKILGEKPPEQCCNYDWSELGEPLQNWYREKADRVVEELWSLGYKAEALDVGTAGICKLPSDVLDQLCKLENKNWDEMNRDDKAKQKDAAKRLLEILAELNIQVVKDEMEILAIAIHKHYLMERKREGETSETNPFLVEWDKLPEYKKESNREAAEYILILLKAIGCDIRRCTDPNAPLFQFNNEEIERMAEMEHERWVEELSDKGWTYGQVKDVKKKTNPNLVKWKDLPEDVKDWNRNQVRKIPEILASVGLVVYRVNSMREIIAQAIHEQYLEDQKKAGHTPITSPHMVAWEDLPEEKKESNRLAADHIIVKLKAIGCAIRRCTDPNAPLFQFTNEEIERMAEMEHERWVEEHQKNSWTYGPVKDVRKKTSPYLVPWKNLDEKIRDIDRSLVRAIPQILAKVGLEIYRTKNERGID